MESTKLLIHVGYPKTATTWLQQNIFDAKKFGFVSPWGQRAALAIDTFVNVNHFQFDYSLARQRYEDGLSSPSLDGLIPVISEENLIGEIVKGCPWGKNVADHLSETFPNAKILITVREQCSFILSAYAEYILNGGACSLKRYIGGGPQKTGFSGICRLTELEYDKAVTYYQRKFGGNNVKVLFFEDLLHRRELYVKSLSDFTGTVINNKDLPVSREHVSDAMGTLCVRRYFNKYIPPSDQMHNIKPMGRIILNRSCSIFNKILPVWLNQKIKRNMRFEIDDFVGGYFRESNSRLKELTGYLPSNYIL